MKEKKFRQVSWTDLQSAFENSSGKPLEWFFRQWIHRSDVPAISLKDVRVVYQEAVPTVSFALEQRSFSDSEPYTLDVKVKVTTNKGQATKMFHIVMHILDYPMLSSTYNAILEQDKYLVGIFLVKNMLEGQNNELVC